MTTPLTKSSGFLTAALAFASFVGVPQTATASFFKAYVCDDALCTGGGDTIVTDQGAGDAFPGSAQVGQINAGALSVGGFTIATNVSQSKSLIGSNGLPQLDLSFSATTSDNLSRTVYLYASDTDFAGGGSFQLTLGGTQAPGNVGDVVTGRAWGANSNNNLDLSNLLAVVGPSGLTPFALSSVGSFLPIVNSFGLTIGIQITRGSAGTTTGDLNLITGTPEPSSIALLVSGLIGLGWNRRRFSRKG